MARCKDCITEGVLTDRPAPRPGPRCQTHHRLVKKERSARAHALRTESVYGITGEQYDQLYVYQGGVCWICRRATGKTKRLAVDHNHDTGEVRGLLCSTDNRYIGHLRDNPEALRRAADYLENPPARACFDSTNQEGQK